MKLGKIYTLTFFLVFLIQSTRTLDYKEIFCPLVASYPFIKELLATMQDFDREPLGQSRSTVSQAEEAFIRQTFEEYDPHFSSLIYISSREIL